MDIHEKFSNEPLRPDLRQQNASSCNIFKGKLSCSQPKCKNNSKVPISVKSPTLVNKKRRDRPIKLDDSGDRLGKTLLLVAQKSGTSKVTSELTKKLACDTLKPSQIPRRKPSQTTSIKESILKNLSNMTSKTKVPQFLGESRNVKTVQLLINQDYHPEERNRMATTARPIPTLGQIYGRTNVIETNRVNDWFADIDAPANSFASNISHLPTRPTHEAQTIENNDNTATRFQDTHEPNDKCGHHSSAYKYFNKASDWVLSSEDYPTRENESSGYRSMSPRKTLSSSRHSVISITSQSGDSSVNNVHQQGKPSITNVDLSVTSSNSSKLHEQPTVVIAKLTPLIFTTATYSDKTAIPNESQTNSSTTLKTGLSSDIKHHYHYPSTSACSTETSKNIIVNEFNVPSYMDCSSEILQKTTNFEGCDFYSASSTNGTRANVHDGLRTQLNVDLVCGTSLDDNRGLKPKVSESSDVSEITEVSEKTSVEDSMRYHFHDNLLTVDKSVKGTDINPNECEHCNNCGKRYRGRFKRKQRYRRFPSGRYKLPQTFSSFRRNLSKCNCTRRLSRVWKKTAERWAMWSAKSPHRINKYRIMHILETSLAWEDVHVQTNIFIYKEAGTGFAPIIEQKSEALSTFPQSSNLIYHGNESDINQRNYYRSSSMGPSMYPFVYNSKTSSIRKLKVQSAPTQNCCDNIRSTKTFVVKTINMGTQKTENNAINSETDGLLKNPDPLLGTNESIKYSTGSSVQKCVISFNDNITDAETRTCSMKDSITSTLLNMDDLHMINSIKKQPQNAFFQKCVMCNDAETNVEIPFIQDKHLTSVFTSTTEKELFHRAYGTNTELNEQHSMNVMTSNWIKTYNNNETQITPMRPTSSTFMTPKIQLVNKSVANIFIGESKLERKRDITTQITYLQPSLMFRENKMTCSSMVSMQTISVATSGIKNMDIGTDTNNIPTESCSYTNKLMTYLNTGMLLNTMLERVVDGSPKISICTDTKSIGNEYTSDIGTCTNTVLKDSVIETEKEIFPRRYSANTNTYSKQESRFTELDEAFAGHAKQTRIGIGTQYSNIDENGATQPLQPLVRSQCVGDSVLISFPTLTNPVSEVTQTEISFCDEGLTKAQQMSMAESSNLYNSYSLDGQVLSNLDAEKWMKAGIDKGYRPLLEIKQALTAKDIDGRNTQNSSDLISESIFQTSEETNSRHMHQTSEKISDQLSVLPDDQINDLMSSKTSCGLRIHPHKSSISRQLINKRSDQHNDQLSVHSSIQTSTQQDRMSVESQLMKQQSSNENNTRACDCGTQSDHSCLRPKNQFNKSSIKSSEENIKQKSSETITTSTSKMTLGNFESQLAARFDQFRNNNIAEPSSPQLGEISKSDLLNLVPDNKSSFGDGRHTENAKSAENSNANIQSRSRSILIQMQELDENKREEPNCEIDMIQVPSSPNQKIDNNNMIDVLNTKELKEIDLQASPEYSDAATECLQEKPQKSASVLTSRCILPCLSYCICDHPRSGNLSGECMFVYDKPHCIVHSLRQNTSHYGGVIQPQNNKPCKQVQSVGVNVNTYFRSQSGISAAFSRQRSLTSKQGLLKEALSRMSNSFRKQSNTSAGSTQENEAESKLTFEVPVFDERHINDTNKSQSIISTSSIRQTTVETSKLCIQKSTFDKNNINGLQSHSILSTGTSRKNNAAVFSVQKSKMNEHSYFKSQSILCTEYLNNHNEAPSSFLSLDKDTFEKTEKTASQDNVERSSIHFGMPETELCQLCYQNEAATKPIGKLDDGRDEEEKILSDDDSVRDSDCAIGTAVEIMIKAQLQPPDAVVPSPAKKSVTILTTKSLCPTRQCGTQITKSAMATMLKGRMQSVEIMAVPKVQSANSTTPRYFHQTFPEETDIIDYEIATSSTTSQLLDVLSVKEISSKDVAKEFDKSKVNKKGSKDIPEKEDSRDKLKKENVKSEAEISNKIKAEEIRNAQSEKEVQDKAEVDNKDMPEKDSKDMPYKHSQHVAGKTFSSSNSKVIKKISKKDNNECNLTEVESVNQTAEINANNKSNRSIYSTENRSAQMRVAYNNYNTAVATQVSKLRQAHVCNCGCLTNSVETQVTQFDYDTITKYQDTEATKDSTEKAIVVCNLQDADAATLLRAEMHSAAILATPILQSAAAMTSRCLCRTFPAATQVASHTDNTGVRQNLATSYRYYTALLTRHLDQVIENFANHFGQPTEESHIASIMYAEACTMKPSARKEFACQTIMPCYKTNTLGHVINDSTIGRHDKIKLKCILDPSVSVTDICRHDKEHLKSVYYVLTAIEGRLRRFKTSIDNYQ